MPVHHRLRFLTFPDADQSALQPVAGHETSQVSERVPFGRDVAFDPPAERRQSRHSDCRTCLPSTVPSVSASRKVYFFSWLNPPPHPITVYASHPPVADDCANTRFSRRCA